MGPLGFQELIVIFVIALLVFGPKKLPELGKSLGKGIREFKRSLTDTQDAILGNQDERPPAPRQLDSPSQPAPSSGEPKRLSQ